MTAHVEVCAFDTHRVMNPEVYGEGYQQGPLWRASLRGAVLARDGGRCVYCGSGDELQIERVVAKSRGGSDRIWNRVTACRTCNEAKDRAPLEEWLARETRPAVRERALAAAAWVASVAKGHRPLNAMAAVNVVGPAIAHALEGDGYRVERSSGADTAVWRRDQRVEKSRAADAAPAPRGDDRSAPRRALRGGDARGAGQRHGGCAHAGGARHGGAGAVNAGQFRAQDQDGPFDPSAPAGCATGSGATGPSMGRLVARTGGKMS